MINSHPIFQEVLKTKILKGWLSFLSHLITFPPVRAVLGFLNLACIDPIARTPIVGFYCPFPPLILPIQ
jgi:hypothetical protein